MKWIIVPMLLAAGCAPMPPMAEATCPCAITETVRIRYIATKFRKDALVAIQADANARTARVLRPGDPATMDVREDRLTILLDDMGRIDGLRCG